MLVSYVYFRTCLGMERQILKMLVSYVYFRTCLGMEIRMGKDMRPDFSTPWRWPY